MWVYSWVSMRRENIIDFLISACWHRRKRAGGAKYPVFWNIRRWVFLFLAIFLKDIPPKLDVFFSRILSLSSLTIFHSFPRRHGIVIVFRNLFAPAECGRMYGKTLDGRFSSAESGFQRWSWCIFESGILWGDFERKNNFFVFYQREYSTMKMLNLNKAPLEMAVGNEEIQCCQHTRHQAEVFSSIPCGERNSQRDWGIAFAKFSRLVHFDLVGTVVKTNFVFALETWSTVSGIQLLWTFFLLVLHFFFFAEKCFNFDRIFQTIWFHFGSISSWFAIYFGNLS